MAVQAYINFNGNCREAVTFYSKVFKTEEPRIMTFGEAPPNPAFPLPEGARNWVMHTFLVFEGGEIMFSDTFPGMPFVEGNNITLTVISKDMEAVKSYFNQLKEGGTVTMDLQETFWSKCFGSVKDKFGIYWQLSYDAKRA